MTPPFPLLPASLWEHVPVFREAYLCVRQDEKGGATAVRDLGASLRHE